MKKIIKKGGFYPKDFEGFLINELSLNNIKPSWRTPIKEIINGSKEILGDNLISLYIRGSVASGNSIKNHSDFDTFIVIKTEIQKENIFLFKQLSSSLNSKYSFCPKFDFEWVTEDKLINDAYFKLYQYIIKIQSILLFGKDYSVLIQKFKPSFELATLCNSYSHRIEFAKNRIINSQILTDIEYWCVWLMKTILRCSFEITIERENEYTRDLYLCSKVFKKYYPEKSNEIDFALEIAINPISQKDLLITFIDTFGLWLNSEIEEIIKPNIINEVIISKKYLL